MNSNKPKGTNVSTDTSTDLHASSVSIPPTHKASPDLDRTDRGSRRVNSSCTCDGLILTLDDNDNSSAEEPTWLTVVIVVAAMPISEIAGQRTLKPHRPSRTRASTRPSRYAFDALYEDWPTFPIAAAIDEYTTNNFRLSHKLCLCSQYALWAFDDHTSSKPDAARPPRIIPSRSTPAACTMPSIPVLVLLLSLVLPRDRTDASMPTTASSDDTSHRITCTSVDTLAFKSSNKPSKP